MTSPIPPFQDETPEAGGFKAILQLFLVPLLIVVVAGGVFMTMNFLIGGESSAEDILEKVYSGDSRRRGQAAFELAMRIRAEPEVLESPTFRSRLLSVYENSANQEPEIRRYLTQVLSMASIPEAVPALLEATQDTDPPTRLYAVAALGNAGATEAFDRLAELTQADDPGLRSVSVAALVALKDDRAIPVLEPRLVDSSVDVAWNAANALAHLGSDAGETVLTRMLDSAYLESQPGITPQQMEQAMVIAVEGLAKLQEFHPTDARRQLLEETGQNAPHSRVRNAAMLAIRGEETP